jgi:tripartite-type tricarboxylate transporter receptor subunit TctC
MWMIEQIRGANVMPKYHFLNFVASLFLICLAQNVVGQTYPDRQISLVVPGAASGGMDVIARALAERLSLSLKQSIIVDNKPGANGNIAADLVAKSRPDGYTVLLGQTAQFAINPALYQKIPFDPIKDFVPIVLLAEAPNIIFVASDSPYKTLSDIVKAAQVSSKTLDLATPGNGTPSHLISEIFQKASGTKFTHIPYKSATAAITDLVGGRVAVMMSSVPSALGQIKSGKVRPIAVSSAKRIPVLPNVPTIGESGYPGFNMGTWYGLFVPKGTSPSIVNELNVAANLAINSPVFKEKIFSEGGVVIGGDSKTFVNTVANDFITWNKIVKESGAMID